MTIWFSTSVAKPLNGKRIVSSTNGAWIASYPHVREWIWTSAFGHTQILTLSSQSCGFSSSHVWMWELDYKESWALKEWCFWTMMLEKSLENPLDWKEFKPVNPKENWSWIFIRSPDVEVELPIFWPPDTKDWLTGKDPDAGKNWRQEEKRMTEEEMVGWHHWLYGHEFKQAPGVSDAQGSLVCCNPWDHKQSDTTEWLNWTELKF